MTEWLARDRHALRERVGLEPARQDSHLLAGASRAATRDRIVQRPRPTSIIQLAAFGNAGAAQGPQHRPLVFLTPRARDRSSALTHPPVPNPVPLHCYTDTIQCN